MPAWSLFVWLAIGAIAGLSARRFIGGTPPFGKIGDMILGIAGALLLVWLSNRIKVKS